MNRLMLKIVTIFLALNSISAVNAITPLRAAKCYFAPNRYNCHEQEIREAAKWMTATTIAAATAAGALIGVGAAAVVAAKEREEKINAYQQIRKNRKDYAAGAAQ